MILTTEEIIVYLVTILTAFILFDSFIHPIRKDRAIYAKSGWYMLGYSLCWVLFVIGAIYSGVKIWEHVSCSADSDVAGHLVNNNNSEDSFRFSLIWRIVCQFADPGNLPLAEGNNAHIVALISAFAGIFCLSGLVLSSFVNHISRKAQQWRDGEIYYNRGFYKYVVVIGANEQAATIIKDALKRKGVKYVLVQTRKDVSDARQQLWLKLNDQEENRVVFFSGERTSYEDVKKLKLEKALEVYVLGEEMGYENEQDHDAFNIKCLELISSYVKKITDSHKTDDEYFDDEKKLKCHVDLEYQSTYTIFKSTQIYSTLDKHVEFIPFNVHEIWAKKVLIDNYAIVPAGVSGESKVYRYKPLDGEHGIQHDSEETVHLFIIGMNQMGTALAMQAAQLLHFPNYESNPTKKRRTTITFIDDHAVKEGEFLMGRFSTLFELSKYRIVSSPAGIKSTEWIDPMQNGRFKHLGENFMDIQWEFIQGNVATLEIQKYMTSATLNKEEIVTLAVCFSDPQQSIATAVYLPEAILKHVQQVLVYQRNNFDLITKVATGEKQWKRYAKLRPFGMIEGCYKGGQLGREIAKLTYALYREKKLPRIYEGQRIAKIDQWWGELGIVEKLFNINVSDTYGLKLRSMRQCHTVFTDENVAKHHMHAEHNRWVTERLTFGFRPLTQKESTNIANIHDEMEREREKRRLIAKYRAHLDLCSNKMIDVVDPSTRKNEDRILRNLELLIQLNHKIIIRKVYMGVSPSNYDHSYTKAFLGNNLVLIRNFMMEKKPVTQAQWEMVMGRESNLSGHRVPRFLKRFYPVENVSWDDIQDFICILNDRTGLNFQLPSIYVWKLAASGRKTSSLGPVLSKASGRPRKHSHRIGRYVNSFGLEDILGNVWEWTNTPYDKSDIRHYMIGEERFGEEIEILFDPKYSPKEDLESEKLFRFCGGSWRFGAKQCDIYSQDWDRYWIRTFRSPDLGFRLILPNDHVIDRRRLAIEKKFFSVSCNRDCVIDSLSRDEKYEGKPKEQYINSNLVTVYERKSAMDKTPVAAFKIGRTPVTQEQWKAVMGEKSNPSYFRGDNLPVENVSYQDVMTFIKRLRRITGKPFRLPTVSEWEFVARGGYYQSDDEYAGGNDVKNVAWIHENARSTQPVKKKAPVNISLIPPQERDESQLKNLYDVFDMSGNVWEWCSDWHGDERNSHEMKGGSWKFDETFAAIRFTTYWIEEYKSEDLGFRLVLDIDTDDIDHRIG